MAKRKKDNDQPNEENLNQADDGADNFGLPDIDYKPLDRTEPEEPVQETFIESPVPPVEKVYERTYERTVVNDETAETIQNEYEEEDEEEERSNAPVIISIVIALALIGGGFAIWKYWYVPRAEKAKMEQARLANESRLKLENDQRLAREKEEAERKRLEAEAAANAKPAVGTIETLGGRTNKFYVVVSSDIDDDLIMDYAKRLSAKGVSTKIVPPYGKTKFYRLAMGEFDSYDAAQTSANASKSEYGNTLWVIKY